MKDSAPEREHPESEETGLPGLRSWRAVYGLVLASFVVWMALLFILGQVFR